MESVAEETLAPRADERAVAPVDEDARAHARREIDGVVAVDGDRRDVAVGEARRELLPACLCLQPDHTMVIGAGTRALCGCNKRYASRRVACSVARGRRLRDHLGPTCRRRAWRVIRAERVATRHAPTARGPARHPHIGGSSSRMDRYVSA